MNILLCVTGSVSCILTDKIAAALSQLGEVRIALTHSATKFLTPDNFKFAGEFYTDKDELNWKKRGDSIPHIDLSKWADILVIAPLTANTLATFAAGMANSLISNIVRAWDFRKPAVFALSMNPQMLDSTFTDKHKTVMETIGAVFVPTQSKKMMCGDIGNGAMANIDVIIGYVRQAIIRRFGDAIFLKDSLSGWMYAALPKDLKDRPFWEEDFVEKYGQKLCGGLLEDRSAFFDSRHDASKHTHLGVDFWRHKWTQVNFPYREGTLLAIKGDSGTKGGWGNRVDILIEVNNKPYVVIFAHLDPVDPLLAGVEIKRGVCIGKLGEYKNNGGWKPHLHLQIISLEAYNAMPDFDAYAAIGDPIVLHTLDPITLLPAKESAFAMHEEKA